MYNVDKILVPTDFSEYADLALKRAMDLATACDAKIYLTYVSPEAPDIFKLSKYYEDSQGKILAELEKECRALFEKQIAPYVDENKSRIQTNVLNGIPYREILKYQKKLKPDMMVVATHGETGLEEFLFGSTSNKIIRHAGCSVLVVRKPKYS